MRLYRARGTQVQENWLLLLYAIHYEREDYDALLRVLRELVRLYPSDRHLVSLAGVYGELQDTARQLALTEVLYENAALEAARHALNLANLYLLHDLPYKAAVVLQEALDTGALEAEIHTLRLLAQAWQQAQEHARALAPLARAAALATDGSLYVHLAQSHINLEQWPEAAQALQQALARGGLERRHEANLMLGIALFHQRMFDAAHVAFTTAMQDEPDGRTAAKWLAHIDRELKLQQALQHDPALPRKRDAGNVQ